MSNTRYRCTVLLKAALVSGLMVQPLLDQTAWAANKTCNPQDFTLAIDVGHTPEDPGALSARGHYEHGYNLSLATAVAKLGDYVGFKTHLIKVNGKGQEQLKARREKAEALRPDFLVSIHHDSVQKQLMKKWFFNGKDLNYNDEISGLSLFISSKTDERHASLALARHIADNLLSRGFHFTLHHAQDLPGEGRKLIDQDRGIYDFPELAMLKSDSIPTVLLEAGVLTNRDEEAEIATRERQAKVAAAIVLAAQIYCDERISAAK